MSAESLTRAKTELERLADAVRDRGDGARLGLAVVDVDSGERLEWTADEPFSSASVIKVPILVTALGLVDDGTLDLEQPVPTPRAAAVGGSGVLKELTSVDELSLRDLLTLMTVISDNTATNLVIDLIGIEAVTTFARGHGYPGIRAERKLMDLAARERGADNTLTAHDVASLFTALVRGELLSVGGTETALDVLTRQQVNDRLPKRLPFGTRVAHKTGEIEGVRHDAGVLYLGPNERPVVAVVLTEGFPEADSAAGVSGGDATEVGARVGAILYDAYHQG